MRLSKQQLRALRKTPVSASEINRDGNRRRTFLSLLKKGLVRWDVCERLECTKEGRKALREAT
jgi:hypothetical protein